MSIPSYMYIYLSFSSNKPAGAFLLSSLRNKIQSKLEHLICRPLVLRPQITTGTNWIWPAINKLLCQQKWLGIICAWKQPNSWEWRKQASLQIYFQSRHCFPVTESTITFGPAQQQDPTYQYNALQPTKKNQESERRSIPGPMARTVFDPAETWFKITVKSRYWPKQKKKPKNKTERERVHSNTIVTLSFSKKMRENLVRSQNTLNIHNHVEH